MNRKILNNKSLRLKIYFIIFSLSFQSVAYAQTYTCLRCGGDGKIYRECSDCPPYEVPEVCFNCKGKGQVRDEDDRYFYSNNTTDLIYQYMSTMFSEKRMNQYRKELSTEIDARNRILTKSLAIIDIGRRKKLLTTDYKEYLKSIKNVKVKVGNFWETTRAFHKGQVKRYKYPLQTEIEYIEGFTKHYILSYGKAYPKSQIVINIQLETDKALSLDEKFYEENDINGTEAFWKYRPVGQKVEVFVYDENNKLLIKEECYLGLSQYAGHRIDLDDIETYTKKDIYLWVKIKPWIKKKDVGKEHLVKIKFLDFDISTKILIAKEDEIKEPLLKIINEHTGEKRGTSIVEKNYLFPSEKWFSIYFNESMADRAGKPSGSSKYVRKVNMTAIDK